MATKTFTNEQLVQHWAKAAKAEPQGARRDVVLGIMSDMGQQDTPENYRKVYNNVTQRVKRLGEILPTPFPKLAEGKKGARHSGAEIATLTAILAGGETAPAEGAGETATEGTGETAS